MARLIARRIAAAASVLRGGLDAELLRRIAPHLDGQRQDGPQDLRPLLERARQAFGAVSEQELEQLGRRAADATRRGWRADLARVLGIDPALAESWLEPLLRAWSRENAALIVRVREDLIRAVAQAVQEAVQTGERAERVREKIARELLGRGAETDVSKARRRAVLIARDQVGKLTGDIDESRQRDLGVSRYRWRTSRDERVRDTHHERDGRVFRWGTAIEPQLREQGLRVDRIDGHPGRPINCRCTAEPILEDLVPGLPSPARQPG